MANSRLNFAEQDLRNRSFKGQNLNQANFSGADLRGCDFSYALLQGANFQGVRLGQTSRQLLMLIGVAVSVALLTLNAFSHMIFGVLGRTPSESGWSLAIALYISLALAGTFGGIRAIIANKSSIFGRITLIVSGAASAALVGFFYGGSTTNNNSQMAILGAVLGGLIMAILLISRVATRLMVIAVAVAGAVSGYGLAFLFGTVAIANFSVQNLIWGMVWGTLSLIYIAVTMVSLKFTVTEIKGVGTSFRGADLTNAIFDQVILQNIDFKGSIGYIA
ncbi:MAG: pentapeptide repeat-containing protein [Coleofasciculaceae cyanobacterium]